MSTTIVTDHKWKSFVYRSDVPAKILAGQFDYLSEDDATDGFFRYRRNWYHLSDFMRSESTDPVMSSFDGIAADSYFSAVAIRVSRDGESYKVATLLS